MVCERNPACTEGYEGFYHLNQMAGGCDKAEMDYLIRDHDEREFENKKQLFSNAVHFLNQKYGEGTVTAVEQISYSNMKKKIELHMHLIENAKDAMRELGIEPKIQPIRGGTDGARLSYMGIPCPNLCTGGANYHSRYEYACVQSMESCVQLILKIIARYADR